MAEKSSGLFAGAGFKLPAAAPDAAQPDAGASLFEGAGFSLPGAKPAVATPMAATGGVYVPWLGTYAKDQAEYDRLLAERAGPGTGAAVATPAERVAGAVKDIGGSVVDEFGHSRAMAGTGIVNVFQNQPATGFGQIGMGALGMLTSPLAAIKAVATKATGNKDFGEKAAMLVPGRALTGAVAKAVPEINALNTLVRDIPAKDLPNVISRLESNPTLSAMDVAPNVQSKAMGISTGEPSKGAAHLFEAAAKRAEESTPRLTKAFDEAMGPVPDTVELLGKFKADARRVGSEQIQPALAAAKPVDITSVIASIDDKIGQPTIRALREGKPPPLGLSPEQQRLVKLRQDLTYRGKDSELFPVKDQYFIDATTNPVAGALDVGAHGVQSRLRYEAETLGRSAQGSERLVAGELSGIRNKLVDAIDTAAGGKPGTPGPYREALSAYRDEMHVQEAFERGMTLLSGAKAGEAGLANRPEAWRAWMKNASDSEIAAARLGARTAFDNAMGTVRNEALAGRAIPDVRFVRDKMEMLFGPANAKKIVAEAEAEQLKAQTNALLTANSKTARSRAAQEAIKPREVGNVLQLGQTAIPAAAAEGMNALLGAGGMTMGLPTAALIGTGIARKLAQKTGRMHDIATNDAYSIWASATAPNQRELLLNALRVRAEELSGGKKLGNALTTVSNLPLPH
jgi:hypothetical protein